MIADNPRKKGRSCKVEVDVLLKSKCYLVEQFNELFKGSVLDECWLCPREIVKKASMVMAGLIGLNAIAIEAIVEGEESLRMVSKHWA